MQVESRRRRFSQGASSKLLLLSHLHLEMCEGGSGEDCRARAVPTSGFLAYIHPKCLSSQHLEAFLSSAPRNISTSNSWNTHRPAREKLHLFLRSCRAALRCKPELIAHHCQGLVLQPLFRQGLINPVHIRFRKSPPHWGVLSATRQTQMLPRNPQTLPCSKTRVFQIDYANLCCPMG